MHPNRMPAAFAPEVSASADVRIAHALEFIAARMAMVEFDTTIMREEIIMLRQTLAALAARPPRPGAR